MIGYKWWWLACCAFLFQSPCQADDKDPRVQLTPTMQAKLVKEINDLLVDQYIFLDIAEKMASHLESRLARGEYESITDPEALCSVIRQDLHDISKDNHFFLEYNPRRAALIKAQETGSAAESAEADHALSEQDRVINYGFKKLECLNGNIGYLDLQLFSEPVHGGETAIGAMAFLANSDAIIIDLRDTPGGSPNMVQLICSYFIKGSLDGRTHLNSFERRYNDSLEQFWTLPYVPGKTMYDVDLYVLISNSTGSGAEEFAYNMKNLKRATLVGETTRGSAHPVDAKVILDQYVLHLPTGRPVNPISKTNWERTGVEPDIRVAPDEALEAAYFEALKALRASPSLSEPQKHQVDWAHDLLNAKRNPVEIPSEILASYAGRYGDRTIRYENGKLHYQRNGEPRELVPLNETTFTVAGLDYFRIKIKVTGDRRVQGVLGLYADGYEDYTERTP